MIRNKPDIFSVNRGINQKRTVNRINAHSILDSFLLFFQNSYSLLWYSHSSAKMCLMIGTVFRVSDMTRGSLVLSSATLHVCNRKHSMISFFISFFREIFRLLPHMHKFAELSKGKYIHFWRIIITSVNISLKRLGVKMYR